MRRRRGPGARKRKRRRMRRRFVGDVTRLEQKPLFTGLTLDSVGLSFIAAHELGPAGDQAGTFTETPSGPSGGFAVKPYTNPAGNAAIGYGHLLHDGSVNGTDEATYPNPIDQAQANSLLNQDTAKPVAAVNADVKVVLTQDQFDALVDFSYNEGSDVFAKSALLKNVNSNEFGKVPAQLERWVYGVAGGNTEVIPGLVNRRNDEANLFEGHTGDDKTGDGPATGFSSGHAGNTFGGVHNKGSSPGSGETGSGGGAGNIYGGGFHTAGGGTIKPVNPIIIITPINTIVAINILNSVAGYTTCDGYSPFSSTAGDGASPYAGSTPVNGSSAPYGSSPYGYSSPSGASPYNNYYPVTGSAGGGTGGGGTVGGGGGTGGGGTVGGGGGGTGGGGTVGGGGGTFGGGGTGGGGTVGGGGGTFGGGGTGGGGTVRWRWRW